MKGFIHIKVTEHGYGLDCDLDEISVLDKMELMHTVAAALNMTEEDMFMYTIAEQTGVFKSAEERHQCDTAEDLERLLQGEEVIATRLDGTEVRV